VFHTLYFSSNFFHHGSCGAAVDSAPSQEDPYSSPIENFKSIACSVQELLCFKVGVENCDLCSSSTQQQQHDIGCLRF
jgi:hypothetical protein